jgi:multiple sugar transport system substrate-binding protein
MERKKLLIIIALVAVLVIGGILAFIFFRKPSAPQPVTLEFWGVFDNSDVYKPLIKKFTDQYPYITVNYRKKNIETYESELIDALAANRGPDIFAINNTWLPKHIDKMVPTTKLFTPKMVKEQFVDAVLSDFVDGDKVYALPLSVDSLALFYNKDLINAAGIAQPPSNWAEFNTDVEKLTKRDSKNNILQAGAALGTAKNINRSTDILAMLMLQSGAKMVSDDKKKATFNERISTASTQSFNPGEQALIFYTNFANPIKKVYTWNQIQHYSIDAFVEGKVGMMLSYAYQIPVIRSRAPHLNFDVAAIPQISADSPAVSFANYWGLAVSKTSKNAAAGWNLITFLANQESSKSYAEATQKPVARRDLIDWQKEDVALGIFARQALYAKSWWEIDNLAVETIFAQMIESVAINKVPAIDAVQTAARQITMMMGKETEL